MKRKVTYRINYLQKSGLCLFFTLFSLLNYGQLTVSKGSFFSNKGLLSIGEEQIIIETQAIYGKGDWFLIGKETQNLYVEEGVLNKLTIANKKGVQFNGILSIKETLEVKQGNFMIAGNLQLRTSKFLLEKEGQLFLTEGGELLFEFTLTSKVNGHKGVLAAVGTSPFSANTHLSENFLNLRYYNLEGEQPLIELQFLTRVKQVEIPPPESSFV